MTADMTKQNEKVVMKVSINSMIGNIVLSIFKVFAGFVSHSGAMVSDGVHSASDVFSTVIVMVGYKMSGKESDENHQYGHERIECVAAILLAMVLCVTGFAIGASGLEKIFSKTTMDLQTPTQLALIAAIVSILVKEGMYHYTKFAAKKVNSGALMADAWHHRSDALSSVGSLVGIGGAMLGFPICDPIASVVISVFIIKAAYDIFKDGIDKMMDTACDVETLERMKNVIVAQNGVLGIDAIQTRQFGARAYVDVEIAADGNLNLTDAQAIAGWLHHAIGMNFPEVKHCMVHINPQKTL